MKKTILSIVLVLALLTCVVACNKNSNSGDGTSTQSPEATKTIYDILNELSEQKYQKVTLDISTVTGDIELKAEYVITDTQIKYSVEQLNLLPPDGNLENASLDYKTILSGTATVENGTVTKLDGDSVSIPSYDELKGAFHFKESNFKNIQTENGKLTAEVVSASDFLGTGTGINNMKIVVDYSNSALQKITLTYQTANSTVTTVYEFVK